MEAVGGEKVVLPRKKWIQTVSAIPKFILILPAPVPETLYRQKPYRGNCRWGNIDIFLLLVLARRRPYNPQE